MLSKEVKDLLIKRAIKYESVDFLEKDPSWFMHQVKGDYNKEVMAFIASSLSYGSREQFIKKIDLIFQYSKKDAYGWVKQGEFLKDIPDDKNKSFYRLTTCYDFNLMLKALREMLIKWESIGNFIKANSYDGLSAIKAITAYFSLYGVKTIIPKDTNSACKRICMFLRWMVRDSSPVDLGLWKDFIDKRTLIIPMDTHVVQEARNLGLITSKTVSLSSAIKLTNILKEVFPLDPLKVDFALFAFGVEKKS